VRKPTKAEEEEYLRETGQTIAEFKEEQIKLKEQFDSGQPPKLSDIFKQKALGDCVSANISALVWQIDQGKYPTKAKIPPNVSPDKMVGGVDHQFVAFKENVKRAYDWKLIQGTIINKLDLLPMAHSWCEATLDDTGGLYKRHTTLDGRFVFDFTKTDGQLFFISAYAFDILNRVPVEDHELDWEGNEHHYHRFEYNAEEALTIMNESRGIFTFYEFDADAINAEFR